MFLSVFLLFSLSLLKTFRRQVDKTSYMLFIFFYYGCSELLSTILIVTSSIAQFLLPYLVSVILVPQTVKKQICDLISSLYLLYRHHS